MKYFTVCSTSRYKKNLLWLPRMHTAWTHKSLRICKVSHSQIWVFIFFNLVFSFCKYDSVKHMWKSSYSEHEHPLFESAQTLKVDHKVVSSWDSMNNCFRNLVTHFDDVFIVFLILKTERKMSIILVLLVLEQ